MNRDNFIQEIKSRLKESDNLYFYEKGEGPGERRNGTPVPYLILEIIVFGYMQRDIVRIGGFFSGHGTSLKIDVCTMNVNNEVIPQNGERFYSFSYTTAYEGDFQKKNASDGEIDFDILEYILKDRTPLTSYIK
jgi:hypothetical protein